MYHLAFNVKHSITLTKTPCVQVPRPDPYIALLLGGDMYHLTPGGGRTFMLFTPLKVDTSQGGSIWVYKHAEGLRQK